MGLIICFIMIVAAFNIVGTLTMVVTDKTREIGILQAMGLTAGGRSGGSSSPRARSSARVGTVARAGARSGARVSAWTGPGSIRIDPAVYFIDQLPVHVEPLDVLGRDRRRASLVAVVATIHPVAGGGRLAPVEAIRHE